jgi:putative ABC transport system permease protein
MSPLFQPFRRLWSLFRKRQLESEMSEEMRLHLELRAEREMARGLPPDEARRTALRGFGGVEQLKERCRDARGWPWVEQLVQDLTHAARGLRKSPGFTAVALATLALCIGANSAIFSVVNAILLKPYPWPGSERLVYVHNAFPKMGFASAGAISIPDYLDHHTGVPAFAESALIAGFSANLALDGNPERVYGLQATPSLFSLLQVQPTLGRVFSEAEAEPGAVRTVVLRDDFWKNRYGGDPAVLGRTIRLNGEPYTIVGVLPPGFYFPSQRAQFYVPYAFTPQQRSEADRINQYSTMLARLRPDATREQAQREVDAVHRAAREQRPELKSEHAATGYGSVVLGFLDYNVRDVRTMLWLVQAAVAAALLIGCANVANLLLARASARQRELAIRAALGAGRGRLVRQLLGESLLLFLTGGALGLLVAFWGLGAVNTLGVGDLPRGFSVALDARVFGFTLLCALGTGLVFGAPPAWSATRGQAVDALKAAGTRATASRRQLGLRNALAVTQIALSLMLLATAVLLIKSFARLQSQSPGFAAERTLTASLTLPAARYGTPEKRAAFVAQLTDRVQALPGVLDAGTTNSVPFSGGNPQGGYEIEGRELPPGTPNPNGMMRQVSPGYFGTMGITLLRGRLLTPADTAGRELVVVVDKFLADRFWPGADPLGKRVRRGSSPDSPWSTIVGVVTTVKHWELEHEVSKETLYFPYAQAAVPGFTLVVKTSGDPAGVIAGVREAVLAVDPEQPVFDVKTMEARLAQALQPQRAPVVLLTLFSSVALLLAMLGIYGVLAFSVGHRTAEIGVRMALGATRANILGLVLRQGAALIGIGILLGLAGYAALSGLIGKLLFSIAPTDPGSLVIAPLILALVALAACFLPARRATKVDPMVALRSE